MNSELDLFDKANFGVLRTDGTGRLTYTNEWLRALIGKRFTATSRLRDFASDDASRATLEAELQKRLRGEPGEYQFSLKADNDRSIEMQVFGTPIRDAEGRPAGSVAFLTRLPNTRLASRILAVDTAKLKPAKALDRLREMLEEFDFKFDALVIGIYDQEVEYGRALYQFFRGAEADQRRREKHWAALTAPQRRWILDSQPSDRAIADIDTFFDDHSLWGAMRHDAMVANLRAAGLHSVACALVRDGQKLAASISLFKKESGAYDARDVVELEQLPLDRCVLAVMRRLEDDEAEFRYDLIKVLSRCSTVSELATCVVRKLSKHYGLARAALYGIDWATGTAQLQACSSSADEQGLGPAIALDGGDLVAQVAHSGRERYVPDVHRSGDGQAPRKGSVFCWPVVYAKSGEKRVRWVFYAEDHSPGAFHPAERTSLCDIAAEVGTLLKPLTALHFLQSTFDATSDAIVVIDAQRQIKRANPAAAELLGFDTAREIRGGIEQFVRYSEDVAKLDMKTREPWEMKLRDANQHLISALVSVRPLPPPIDGRVIVIRDMSKIRRLEKESFLGRLAGEIAVQAQTPLTLASSWVQRIQESVTDHPASHEDSSPEVIADLAARTMKQLHRVQSVLDHIAFYDSRGQFVPRESIPLSLEDEVMTRIRSLPVSEQERIREYHPHGQEPILVAAHRPHLAFVLDTMLAYFLRTLPSDDKISIKIGQQEHSGWVTCSVPKRPAAQSSAPSTSSFTGELGLVDLGLQKILEGYGGGMQMQRSGGRVRQARIVLPQFR